MGGVLLVACVMFGGITVLGGFLMMGQSSPTQPAAVAKQSTSAPAVESASMPTETRMPLELPTAKPTATAGPINTPVVHGTPTPTRIPRQETTLDDLLNFWQGSSPGNTTQSRPAVSSGNSNPCLSDRTFRFADAVEAYFFQDYGNAADLALTYITAGNYDLALATTAKMEIAFDNLAAVTPAVECREATDLHEALLRYMAAEIEYFTAHSYGLLDEAGVKSDEAERYWEQVKRAVDAFHAARER